jgi:hypothetical protein
VDSAQVASGADERLGDAAVADGLEVGDLVVGVAADEEADDGSPVGIRGDRVGEFTELGDVDRVASDRLDVV